MLSRFPESFIFRISLFIALGVIAALDSPQASAAEQEIEFSRQVQPILAKRCYACHGPDQAESGLSLAAQESAYAKVESGGFAIIPGDAKASLMIARVTSEDEPMPPEGDPLPPEEIEILRRWIEQGAQWDTHWAFRPMQRSEVPKIDVADWSQNPIDAFIYDSLAAANLQPNPPADRKTLIRRAYYDLTGLPPTAEQIDRFVADSDPLAFEKLVDDLLESPHYGERWGRHWLDLVRYAETNSFERDGAKPNAWKYRDYVIKSFNDDKPYDQFLREQLAGDELDEVTPETITATGYYRLGIWDDEPADILQARFDELDDIILTTGQVMLGLTINCARCHDHKIDPIPQKDYYSMLAFLADVTSYGSRGDQTGNNQYDVSAPELRERYRNSSEALRKLQDQMREIEQIGIAKMSAPDQRATEGRPGDRKQVLQKKLRDNLGEEQWSSYQKLKTVHSLLAAQAKALPPRSEVLGLARCNPQPERTFVLFRGNPHAPSVPVDPAYPSIFADAAPDPDSIQPTPRSAGRRRVLADWITAPDNRLTARVMANRLWQFHYGRGIVRSTNNFGQLGTPPTHPQLLDWLGHQLIEEGWKLKSMHRLIMNSRAYQMSSAGQQNGLTLDPDNDLFWRFDPRRLSAEEVRDSILLATGSLNRQAYGPSIYPELSQEVLAGQSRPGSGWGKSSPEDQNRRSVYIHVKRSLLTPLLEAFDFPDPDLTCEDRFVTLQPGQALALLNSDFIHDQARTLAESIVAADSDNATIVRRTVHATLGRDATEQEITEGNALIKSLINDDHVERVRAIELYCLTVMNWNEFLFVD